MHNNPFGDSSKFDCFPAGDADLRIGNSFQQQKLTHFHFWTDDPDEADSRYLWSLISWVNGHGNAGFMTQFTVSTEPTTQHLPWHRFGGPRCSVMRHLKAIVRAFACVCVYTASKRAWTQTSPGLPFSPSTSVISKLFPRGFSGFRTTVSSGRTVRRASFTPSALRPYTRQLLLWRVNGPPLKMDCR